MTAACGHKNINCSSWLVSQPQLGCCAMGDGEISEHIDTRHWLHSATSLGSPSLCYIQVDRSCNEWLIFNEHLHYPHYDQLEGGWARALTKPIPHLGPLMARVQPRVHCPHRNCAVTTDNGQCPLRNNILQPAPHLVSAECEDASSSSDDFPFPPVRRGSGECRGEWAGDNLSVEAESGQAARIVTHKHREPRDTDIIISQFFTSFHRNPCW